MKKYLFQILLPVYSVSSFAQMPPEKEPLFRLSGGLVYSNIDMTMYDNSVSYRGLHTRLITYLGGAIFVSAEYSVFPSHKLSTTWVEVKAQKFDINGHVSFLTENKLTRIYALFGINRHMWAAKRTALMDADPFAKDVPPGTIVQIRLWGVNAGCGFMQLLYDNISVIGDFRFSFGNAHDFEKVSIRDVMTTIGISFNIPYPNIEKSNRKKTSGTGKKIYKWTEKGAK